MACMPLFSGVNIRGAGHGETFRANEEATARRLFASHIDV